MAFHYRLMRNIFISHIHEDDEKVEAFKQLLERNDYDIRDSSIDSGNPNHAHDPDYIKREILKPGINWAGTVVVLITPQTKDHEWVTWEIEKAVELGKDIVGVWSYGVSGCEIPEALKQCSAAVVSWQSDMIIGAMEGSVRGLSNCDGTPAIPRELLYHDC
jgi:hypothetical protein